MFVFCYDLANIISKLPGEKDFMAAWGGISSLQFGLSLFWSEAVRCPRRGLTVGLMNQLLCLAPARLAQLDHCKAEWNTLIGPEAFTYCALIG